MEDSFAQLIICMLRFNYASLGESMEMSFKRLRGVGMVFSALLPSSRRVCHLWSITYCRKDDLFSFQLSDMYM